VVEEADWFVVVLWLWLLTTCKDAVRVGHEPPMDKDWELNWMEGIECENLNLFRVFESEICLLSVNWPLGGAFPKWQRISLVVVYEERTFFSGRSKMMNIFGKKRSERAIEAEIENVKLAVRA
jgi:hypothetical protein